MGRLRGWAIYFDRGLAYHISPSRDLRDFIIEPIHSIIYVIFILLACGLFSKTWVEPSGKNSRDVAKNLWDNQYFLEGIRENEENIYEYFNKTIPDTLGCMFIGLLTIFAGFMGGRDWKWKGNSISGNYYLWIFRRNEKKRKWKKNGKDEIGINN